MRLGALAFNKGPVTTVALLTYLLILFLVFWTDVLPDIPKDQGGLNLQVAYNDLHHVAARPHPYNSHANDHVRKYILDRVRSISSEYPHVKVFDDLRSNGSWASGDYGVYFEGKNVLVKIDGTDPRYWDKGGVLFSAHYDSVSTAPGVTGDGMGVVTLLQLIEYYAKNRARRTAIFNINNGEEDWLNGAHAFLQHPWSRIPDSFLNLEGAAAGGRPILFCATSAAVLRAFRSRRVPRPHANVLSADAFKRGAIRSGTDYSVYTEGAHMQGLDLAFYKGRSSVTVNLIKEFEGVVAKPAPDPIGLPTVGFGHLCKQKNCAGVSFKFPLTRDTAAQPLQSDLKSFTKCISDAVKDSVKLNDNQFGALSSLAFNVGCGNVRGSTLVKRLNNGENPNTVAGEELPKWNKAGGKVLAGSTSRRNAEIKLFKTASSVIAHPPKC